MNRGSITRGKRARIDVTFNQLMAARAEYVALLHRACGLMLFKAKTHRDRCVQIIRFYKKNPQPRRSR